MTAVQQPKCKTLVLDAGPLLSLSPLRGLAETYVTVPQVLSELKDKNAKEHLERLGLNYGIKIEVKNPDPASLATVIQWAKKTGDYSVLSHPDICVLALTHTLHEQAKKQESEQQKNDTSSGSQSLETAVNAAHESQISEDIEQPGEANEAAESSEDESKSENEDDGQEAELLKDEVEREPLDVELRPIEDDKSSSNAQPTPTPALPSNASAAVPLYEDPSDEDDGEGEWITPSNVGLHKSRALDLLPSGSGKKGKQKDEYISVGCMTADFAMQNVLLQMGLNLVGTEGKRIQRVKTWVLRCHACFKICKDNSKKFCPSCGNPTLIRASVTLSTPNADSDAPVMQVHLKSNFQYKIRGTKYSIPAPKPGSAKTGTGDGLILREDQAEYMRAKKRVDSKREREEAKMVKGVLSKGVDGGSVAVGSWMDPDWVPEIIAASPGGKGRTRGGTDDMPAIGYGRRNPNERRRHKK
ncbi:20S-pre-rRNA D-site endonuclease nob1 [Paramarasmius palmivorus]|uniref:20S-pre-rRNA D-site endonuclease NOB1 n=1 Tax=Paramarasmius palmivorus TaxID=297713 RepID=A0AAW0EBB0_9AGAR